MTTILRLPRTAVRAGGTLAAAGLLVTLVGACSSGGSTATTTQTAAAAQPTAAASGGGGRGFNSGQFAAIRQCLQAAGIAVPSFSPRSPRPSGDRPSFSPGERPSGFPSGVRPSGFRGGFNFSDPKVAAALQACGIAVTTFGPRPGASPS